MALHYQRGWDELEEPSDLHWVVLSPDQESPALEEIVGRGSVLSMDKQCTGSFVVGQGGSGTRPRVKAVARSFLSVSLTRSTARDSGQSCLFVVVDTGVNSSPWQSERILVVGSCCAKSPGVSFLPPFCCKLCMAIQRTAPFISCCYVRALLCPMVQVSYSTCGWCTNDLRPRGCTPQCVNRQYTSTSQYNLYKCTTVLQVYYSVCACALWS